MLKLIEKVATLPTIRLGMRLYLQTMVRDVTPVFHPVGTRVRG